MTLQYETHPELVINRNLNINNTQKARQPDLRYSLLLVLPLVRPSKLSVLFWCVVCSLVLRRAAFGDATRTRIRQKHIQLHIHAVL